MPQRVAARQHRHPLSAAGGDRLDRALERAVPDEALGSALGCPLGHHRQVPGAADQDFGGIDQDARGRGKSGEPVLADPDDAEPALHFADAKALTAAAARALPPRRPRRVT